MYIAKHKEYNHIYDGEEVQSHPHIETQSEFVRQLACPICGRSVSYSVPCSGNALNYFHHTDGTTDCFAHHSSEEHRLAMECTYQKLHNRLHEVTGKDVEIALERRIGSKSNFAICDILVQKPLQISAEIFYKCSPLGLGRRLHTIYSNGYRLYLIFHNEGRHDIDRIEKHLQQVTSLNIGKFKAETRTLHLGDLFDKQKLDLTKQNRKLLPNYIAR